VKTSALRRTLVGALLAVPLLIATACSSSGSTTPSAKSTPSIASDTSAVTLPGTDSLPATESDVPPPGSDPQTFDADLTFGSGSFNLGATTAGLADLADYTATLTVSFDGTDGGQPSKWTNVYVMTVSKDVNARQLTIASSDPADPNRVFRAEVNGVAYDKRGDQPCAGAVIDPSESASGSPLADSLEPASLLSTAIGADPVGTEDANGVPANHYTFDENALGQAGVATSSGDVWVATTGGYLVKYTSTTTAKADFLGEGVEGTLAYDYELTGIGEPIVLPLPDDCPPGLITAPTLPDATDVANDPGSSSFDTASTPADVASFYQAQLPQLGWTPNDDVDVDETSAHLSFVQGFMTLSVDATTDAGVTTVTLAEFTTSIPES
jgi:hypothetical protein